jgi:hypothetical protein
MKKTHYLFGVLLTFIHACQTAQDAEPTLPPEQKAIMLYWTEVGSQQPKIARRKLEVQKEDDKKVEVLFDKQDEVWGPQGLVVDKKQGRVYWADYGNVQILMGNMDGSGSPTVLYDQNDGLEGPLAIALDTLQQALYWSDLRKHQIIKGDTRGTTPVAMVYGYEDGLRGVTDLEVIGEHLYWVEYMDRQVMEGNTNGEQTPHILYDGRHYLYQPYSIEIDFARHYLYILENPLPGVGLGDRIVRGSLDGADQLITLFGKKDSVSNAYSMVLDKAGNHIYWLNLLEDGAIWRGNLSGFQPAEKIVENIYLGFGVDVQ